MGAYEPKYLYVDQISATFSATTTGAQLLAVTGNSTVGPAGTSTAAKVVGVAAYDVAANGRGSYFPRGKVHVSTASGAITAGDQVVAGAAGTVASEAAASGNAAADINNAREILGVALTTAADAASVEWMEF
jgi:hypothetical protein